MRLTTVGTGTAAPHARRVCAGHLVEAGAARLLLDCGPGVVHRLAGLGLRWDTITHVALSHFDNDHIGDLVTLAVAWRWGQLPPRTTPVEVLGPAGTGALVERLAAALWDKLRDPGYPLGVRELGDGEAAELGDGVRIRARKVPHTPESIAYSIERGGRRLVYTGDTGADDGLAAWAAGADVLLAECSLPATMGMPSHLTPEQVGALAARAAPGLLVLTHFYPPVEQVDVRGIVAAAGYAGPVVLADDGWGTEIEER
ncbi:MAG TPA: MBL fold metallo-hydrolase [Gemmatimonadaceae bacterium]|nr:MBL fold metallo-hydrolase [Gemmatimonadaceae bacterium]